MVEFEIVEVIPWSELQDCAVRSAERAHAPYSGLKVGAAGLVDDGRVVTGCNVESASYGLTLCAECGLISDLHRTGGGRLVAVATMDASGEYLMPCGRCRQLLFEAGGGDCWVNAVYTLDDLLPEAFDASDLPDES